MEHSRILRKFFEWTSTSIPSPSSPKFHDSI
jgi:hypothetical protein